MMVKVSVVVAVYNGEKYLEQCIDSILNQTMHDFELICVNDDSKDNTLMILDTYAERDERVQVYSIKNSGLGAGKARNFGLSKARGKYVIVLDADDYFESDMLERLYSHAERERVDIVVFDAAGWDTSNQKVNYGLSFIYDVPHSNKVLEPEEVSENIFSVTASVAWNKFYLRSFICDNKLCFQENVPIIDDLYIVLCSMVKAKRIYLATEKLLFYRYNNQESQISNIHSFPLASYSACKAVKDFLVSENVFDKYGDALARFTFRECLIELERMQHSREAYEILYTKLHDGILAEFNIESVIASCDKWETESFQRIKRFNYPDYIFNLAFGSNENSIRIRYAFPQKDIPMGARVILYGAGRVGKSFYAQNMLDEHCIIVKWVDREYKKYQEKGLPVSCIDNLWEDDIWDFCIIAIKQRVVAEDVQKLMEEHGIEKNRIVWKTEWFE